MAWTIGSFISALMASRRVLPCHDPGGNAHRGRAGGHIPDHDRVRSDLGVIADQNGSEHFGTGAEHHASSKRRVAFTGVPRGTAESHAMIERAVVTDLGGFADHHAHPVVDEHAASYDCPGMDLDSRQPAPPVRQPAAQPPRPIGPQRVRHGSVPNERMEAGVAGQDLPGRPCRRVALEHDRDVFA